MLFLLSGAHTFILFGGTIIILFLKNIRLRPLYFIFESHIYLYQRIFWIRQRSEIIKKTTRLVAVITSLCLYVAHAKGISIYLLCNVFKKEPDTMSDIGDSEFKAAKFVALSLERKSRSEDVS